MREKFAETGSLGVQVRRVTVPALALLGVLCGCTTEAQRRAVENAAIQQEAAREIKRICALPPAERAAELDRINKESGIVVRCGSN